MTTNWYDYPQYMDMVFRDETELELCFFEAAFAEHARRPVRSLFEPGCGSGRLVVGAAARGFSVVGLDQSEASLRYLDKKLNRRGLCAHGILGDMRSFTLPEPVDAAFCTFNTFRHLLTEKDAISHLQSVADAVRVGGLYILGFHVIPLDADPTCTERWKARHSGTEVSVTLRVTEFNRRKRLEKLRASLKATRRREDSKQVIRCATDFYLRLYTMAQVKSLLKKVDAFEMVGSYDFDYEITDPRPMNDDLTDAVFVLLRV